MSNICGNKPLSRTQTRALLKLFDAKIGVASQIGIDKRMAEILIRYGFAKRVKRRPRSFVGTTHTLYAITPLGERECYLTGKRHAV
jgi:hypothetical protein